MKKVLLDINGGIDSTVAALLLLKQGYQLVGLPIALSIIFLVEAWRKKKDVVV